MIPDLSHLLSMWSPNPPLIVQTADGMSLLVASRGTLSTSCFHVHIVSHVPNLTVYFYTFPLWSFGIDGVAFSNNGEGNWTTLFIWFCFKSQINTSMCKMKRKDLCSDGIINAMHLHMPINKTKSMCCTKQQPIVQNYFWYDFFFVIHVAPKVSKFKSVLIINHHFII